MSGAWVLAVAITGALIDAATGHRARRLWRGIPAWVQRRIDAADTKLASRLGGDDG